MGRLDGYVPVLSNDVAAERLDLVDATVAPTSDLIDGAAVLFLLEFATHFGWFVGVLGGYGDWFRLGKRKKTVMRCDVINRCEFCGSGSFCEMFLAKVEILAQE